MISTSTQSSIAKPRKFVRLVWSVDEKNAVTKYFQKYIFLKKNPNKEVSKLKKKHFLNYSWISLGKKLKLMCTINVKNKLY